jgi:Nucleotidyl transferase AbiEii toxin, Type IV TA system
VSEPRYADPGALRQAIADRLRHVARDRPGAQLSDLQRQFAYDRLLARVFSTEPEAWVLKGATALLARLHGSARHTLDIDLYRRGAGLDRAEAQCATWAWQVPDTYLRRSARYTWRLRVRECLGN